MKRNWSKFLWWTVTIIVCLAMSASGIAYLAKADAVVEGITHLGYPLYFLQILGTAKILGVLAFIVPSCPKGLREWAYAGFTFDTIGAVWSSLATGDGIGLWLPPLIVLALIQTSYWLGKNLLKIKVQEANQNSLPV